MMRQVQQHHCWIPCNVWFNNPMTVVIYGVVMAIVGGLAGWIGSLVFKKYPIVTKQDMIDRGAKDA